MTILENVAYLRGLSEGLGIDDSSKEGRMLKAIVDVLDDLALTVTDLEDDVAEISDCLDEIDEDLGELEEEFYGDECDCDCCDCDDDCDCDCDCCCDEELDDEELYEVTCPACGDGIYVNEEMLDEGFIMCPNCNEKLEFDFECEDDCDCGCGCGCGCECDHE